MEKIPFDVVQSSIDIICGITEENELEKASKHLFDVQPDLASFFMEFIEDMSEGAQDLGFMMALILNKSFESQYKGLRSMTEDEVIEKFQQGETEFEKLVKINDELLLELQKQASLKGQPEVLNYMIEELFMSPELEPKLDPAERIHLFIICKFFVDCLNELAVESTGAPLKH